MSRKTCLRLKMDLFLLLERKKRKQVHTKVGLNEKYGKPRI